MLELNIHDHQILPKTNDACIALAFFPTARTLFSFFGHEKIRNLPSINITKISDWKCRVRLITFCIFQVQYFFSIKFLSEKNPSSLPPPQPFLKVNWLFPLQQTSSSIEEDYNMKKLKMTNDNCYKKNSPSPLIWPGEKYQMNLMLSAGNHLFFLDRWTKKQLQCTYWYYIQKCTLYILSQNFLIFENL